MSKFCFSVIVFSFTVCRNALNVREETPLMCAVLRGAVEAAAVLVECGADVTLKNTAGEELISSVNNQQYV